MERLSEATGCVSGKPRKVSLGRNTASLLGEAESSRQLDPRGCNFQGTKGDLKFAATQKVIDLIETKLGSKHLSSRMQCRLGLLNTFLESPSDKSALPKIRSSHEVKY